MMKCLWGAAVIGALAAAALAGPATAAATDTAEAGTAAAAASAAVQDHAIECVDINTAGIEELQRLLHIGPQRAQAIPHLRPFDSEHDITRIPGISEALLTGLIHGGGDHLPLCPIASTSTLGHDEDMHTLPLTGTTVPLLVASGLALGAVGTGTALMARRRRRVFVAG